MMLLPTEWVETTLDNIADWGSGGTPSRNNEDYYGGNIPWIKTGDLGDKLIIKPSEYITELGLKNSSAKLFPKGSVAIAMYGATIGRTSILDIDATTNQACAVGNPKPNITTSEFLYYFLINEKDNFIAKGKGGAQPNISQALIKEHVVYFPPFAEQKEIADRLDQLLAQVEATQARLARIPYIIKQFRQSVLAAAVSGKLTNSGSKYQTIEVTDTWSHEIEGPIHWLKFNFSDVIKIIGGSQPPKSDFLNEPKAGYVRLIQIRDYKTDAYKVYIPLEKAKRLVSKDDVMIGRYGPPIFQILRGLEGAYNVALMKAEPKPELLDKEYLYWYLQNYKLFNYINAGSDRTAGQSGVNKKHLESYPLLVPPIEEQTEIVRRVEQLFAYADSIEQQAKAAKERVDNLTQAILAKAFRGELTADWRAANPDLISGDNSAAALLARIQAERTQSAKKGRKRTQPAP